MRVLLFGATGMVGQGVLRECLLAGEVALVQTVGRSATGQQHPKLREVVHPDLFDCAPIESELANFDACFFCIGVTSSGISEADYTHLTHDLTMAVAQTVARLNPQMTFVYVSGAGADGSESGRSMWARVRGRTENALRRLSFRAVYVFRPGIIQPLHGIRSKTDAYRWFYTLAAPLLPVLRALLPNTILTTQVVGQAMLAAARQGAAGPILEAADIAAAARRQRAPVGPA